MRGRAIRGRVCWKCARSGGSSAEVAPRNHQVVLDEHAIIVFNYVEWSALPAPDLQHLTCGAAAVDAHEENIALAGSHVDR
eukprot:6803289-Prymnesium_polylepis.2